MTPSTLSIWVKNGSRSRLWLVGRRIFGGVFVNVMDEHPKSLTNKKMLVLMVPVCIVICGFYFVMFGGLIDIMPKDPKMDVAKGVKEVEVDAKTVGVWGTVLIGRFDELTAVDVRTGKISRAFKGTANERITSLAGPNKNGLVLVSLADSGSGISQSTRVVAIDLKSGSTSNLMARNGPSWDHPFYNSVAVADQVDLAFYFVGVDRRQLYDPEESLFQGKIQARNMMTGRETTIVAAAFDSEFAVSGDGKSVWFCDSLDRGAARVLPGVTAYAEGKGPVPAIFEQHGGAPRALFAGSNVRWLGDDSPLKIFTWNEELLFNASRKEKARANWPSYVSNIRRIFPSGLVIGQEQQAKVEEVKYDARGGMSGGRQPMQRIVAVNQSTKQIHTIVKYIDSMSIWSYGTYEMPTADQKRQEVPKVK
ncbi:MAG TPA: hypothetical protein VK171_07000 [Fimbriimonas sp.]|nr:hypothetical protein [Fimbriimonas sp.]